MVCLSSSFNPRAYFYILVHGLGIFTKPGCLLRPLYLDRVWVITSVFLALRGCCNLCPAFSLSAAIFWWVPRSLTSCIDSLGGSQSLEGKICADFGAPSLSETLPLKYQALWQLKLWPLCLQLSNTAALCLCHEYELLSGKRWSKCGAHLLFPLSSKLLVLLGLPVLMCGTF